MLLVELSEDPDKQDYGLAGLRYLIVLNSCVQNNCTPNLSEYYQLQIKEVSNTKSTIFCGLSINSIEDKLSLALCTFPCLPRPMQESLVHAVAWFYVCICYSHLPMEVCFVWLCCVYWLTLLCFALSCVLHAIELEVPKCMKWSKCPLHTSSGPWALAFLLVLLHQWLFTRYLAQLF